jgi:L,D-peptidoglycan transpeptidase YkuD (ErfK/YbiS/YcfS/YnhG family)
MPVPAAGQAEARLIEIYRMVAQGQLRQALPSARQLTVDYPNFQLAHLLHGDLLMAMKRPLMHHGNIGETALPEEATATLTALREESHLRLKALRETPPADAVPAEFLQLAPSIKHAVAVDTSKARLYLLENSNGRLRVVSDFYISVGKLGDQKAVEGDQRTPLGAYYVVSNLDPRGLKDFYGAGALPINYPNPVDARHGRTGRGIWLHGTPPNQFSRAPKATDGCVVLANPDLAHVIRTVEPRSTPVVIAKSLRWVRTTQLDSERHAFSQVFERWQKERTTQQPATISDVSFVSWKDGTDSRMVTFMEQRLGQSRPTLLRQYWVREPKGWQVIDERAVR